MHSRLFVLFGRIESGRIEVGLIVLFEILVGYSKGRRVIFGTDRTVRPVPLQPYRTVFVIGNYTVGFIGFFSLEELGIDQFILPVHPFVRGSAVLLSISSGQNLVEIIVDTQIAALIQVKADRIPSILMAVNYFLLDTRLLVDAILVHFPPYGTSSPTICGILETVIVRRIVLLDTRT